MTTSMITRALQSVRASDWWAYKIPPLLAVAYAGFLVFDPPNRAWTTAAGTLAGILLIAVFGYVLNDIFDVEADRRSGRANRMADVGDAARTAWVLVPAAGVMGIGWVIGDALLRGLLALNLLLPALYSMPPVRLKGRGLWGVLADAGAAHALPTAVVAHAVTTYAEASGWHVGLFIASATGMAFLAGLRGILVHQVADLEADRVAGVSTLAGALGVDGSRRLVLHGLFPAELACLTAFLFLVLPTAPAAAFVLVPFAALELARTRSDCRLPLFEPAETSRERYIPVVNNEIYEAWLPFGLAIALALRQPALWLLVATQTVLFFPNLRARAIGAWRTLRPEQSRDGYRSASAQSGRTLGRLGRGPRYRVIIGATSWTVNGVNVFSANLARGLVAAGVPAEVLLTEEDTDLVQATERPMPRPAGVPFTRLPVERSAGWGAHWGAMVRYLEEAAPCIYVPNSDWRHSCVCPRLSRDVVTIGVIHSDDPLHYDHIRRLGDYWNAAAAVSDAVARRAAQAGPTAAGRITTIPIGVRIPAALAPRSTSVGPLRLIYHGILKQHQKRVLEFPKIVAAARDLGVPVHLSLVGAGPDEHALREAARDLVDQGLIRFHGVVSPDETAALLEAHDVYLLASEFEGMPNALIEAMSRGCVPIVTRVESGVPELIRDGENGFLVPVGDVHAFAERLRVLWHEPGLRGRMSASAFATVRDGPYSVDSMVESYRRLFDRAFNDARTDRFVRQQGLLSPPPPEVEGVSLFPVELPHLASGVGAFPSREDAEDYDDQVRATTPHADHAAQAKAKEYIRAAASQIALDGVPVFVSAPVWTPGGINLWSEDLVRGLRAAGLDARLLFTEEATGLVRIDTPRLAHPTDLPIVVLKVEGRDGWGARWGAMLRTLEKATPCIYFPTYDWRHSCVVPALSNAVTVIGSVHDGGRDYLEQAERLGTYWNGLVATSRPLAREMRKSLPQLRDRMACIPHGYVVPAVLPAKADAAPEGICVLLCSSGEAASEETRWMENLAATLVRRDSGINVVCVDPPPAQLAALAGSAARILTRPNRQQWLQHCRHAHFFVARALQGDDRRLLVEAMGHGCIPVLAASAATDRRLMVDGETGLLVPDGEWARAADSIHGLARDPVRRERIAANAHRAARQAGYRHDEMIAAYLDLFRRLLAGRTITPCRPQKGPILPPPAEIDGTSILPVELRHCTRFGRFPSAVDAARFREETGMRRVLFGWRFP